jgi:prolyl oligopeptidase
MARYLLILFSLSSLFACRDSGDGNSKKDRSEFGKITVKYPSAFQDTSQVDNYHGRRIADPYRWLEQVSDPATIEWVRQQRSITDKYLARIPYREAVRKRLEVLWDFERFSGLIRKGDYYYFFRNSGLQDQDVLFRTKQLGDEKAETVLDANTFSEDGTVALGTHSFSKDGSMLAYQMSEAGSDWNVIRVRNLKNGRDLEDRVQWVKFSEIAWHRNGFFYSRYPAPEEKAVLSGRNQFHQLYYHKIGAPQSEDQLIFADRSNPYRNVNAIVTSDERFLVLRVMESTSGNALYLRDLRSETPEFEPIVESFDSDFIPIDSYKDALLVLTNYKAPNWRLIRIHTSRYGERFWEEILPESEDVLQAVRLAGGKILAAYIHNAANQLKVFRMDGSLEQVLELPFEYATVTSMEGNHDVPEAFITLTTLTRPPTIFRLDLKSYRMEVFRQPRIDFDADDYEIKQVFYESYDGVRVPMFIVHKRGIELDAKRPALLYGYGGFNLPVMPQFNRTRINLFPVILENGGVCAVANIRGGGEFGRKWHEAGMREKKQKAFDDFQAAAEYLIANRYTSPEKLAIYGRSNGGLLVGACMTQRPDLYRVALPAVGVMDMLRYQHFTIGWAWASDFGLSDNPREFDNLIAYSPLHNIDPAEYPATLVTTADHDDRVAPAHSFKFTAQLQNSQQGSAPVLIRIDSSAGHGAGKPTSKLIAEGADVLSFLFFNMEEDVIYKYGDGE